MAAVMVVAAMPIGMARADLVPTERVIGGPAAEAERLRVQDFLAREDVRRQIEALGVDPAEASARVDGLSDLEVRKIAGRIDQLPAGQSAVGAFLGFAFLVFVVLLVTDILGYTNIFPFINKPAGK